MTVLGDGSQNFKTRKECGTGEPVDTPVVRMPKYTVIAYLTPILLLYILLPSILIAMGSGGFSLLITCLLVFFPAASLISCLAISIKYGFVWYFPLLVGLAFLPTVYIDLNPSALPYVGIYAAVGYLGVAVGLLLKKYFVDRPRY